jgi:toxin-antitoxin system PIN domain toxin
MILWDVNLWVYAFRADSPLHASARAELEGEIVPGESFLFSGTVAASFLRLVTNPRVFVDPSPLEEAWAFVDALESRPRAVRVEVDAMTWGIFKHLSLVSRTTGNDVPDALLASLAMRHGATFVTNDRRFERFAGLACRLLKPDR